MRKVFFVIAVLFVSCIFSCRDGVVDFANDKTKGSLYIGSTPAGADIYFNYVYTSRITPDSILNLLPGSYSVFLRLTGYSDTTVIANVEPGRKSYISVTLSK